MIDDNPQGFLDLLNQAGGSQGGGDDTVMPGGIGGAGGLGGQSGQGGQGGGSISVALSAQEQKMIDRVRI